MFLITEHNCDNMENYNPIVSTILGYTTTKEVALEVIEGLKANTKRYWGWMEWFDGDSRDRTYPKWSIKQVECLET